MEEYFGKNFAKRCYKKTPEESYRKLLRQLRKINPDARKEDLIRFLG